MPVLGILVKDASKLSMSSEHRNPQATDKANRPHWLCTEALKRCRQAQIEKSQQTLQPQKRLRGHISSA